MILNVVILGNLLYTLLVEEKQITKEDVIEKLKLVEDPEMFLDIWFLGLIYNIEIKEKNIEIEMTFTTPMCPAGPSIIQDVKDKVGTIDGIGEIDVKLVFTPPWEPSEDVKAMMGFI